MLLAEGRELSMDTPIIELKNVTKVFPGVIALNSMSMQIRRGEVHGLIGENGAGKSTLVKVLTGVHQPEEGEYYIDGTRVSFKNTREAMDAGIACVYQEMHICKDASVTDNLFLGRFLRKKNGLIDKARMRERALEILQMMGQTFSPDMSCGKLSVGQQQMVEIGRAILADAKLIILDEPTSSLGETESENLFKTVRNLNKTNGITFLFISHKLSELFTLCDRVTVMRDSKFIITEDIHNLDNDSLIKYMVGRTFDNLYPKVEAHPGETLLEVRDLSRMGEYYHMSFSARRGEILGFSGLVGAGRSELFRTVFGITSADSGEIIVHGKPCRIRSTEDAIKQKIAYLSEDRKNEGLILDFTVKENLVSVVRPKYKKGMKLDFNGLDRLVDEQIDTLNIKVSSPMQAAAELSGGNQQKVVIGKWMPAGADIFIFDEPTKGIDVGAKIEVYKVMNRLVEENKCVIMISSELQEILGMSDRVIVMRNGHFMKEIQRDDESFTQDGIMKAAWGVV